MTEGVRDEFAAFGVVIAGLPEETEEADAVASCNWESLLAFMACDTQWRVGVGFGGMIWIGLDYTACDIVFRRRGFADHIWDDLRMMEEAALPILNSGDE